ncbi:MAG TPA: endonuclease/exonuclease/phosphatase family protein [Bacteriovoracaceae bacterium]|nr:endonuclease/exonuclease/phosphatase family protein [Bacteriovoracaceae bacterium]
MKFLFLLLALAVTLSAQARGLTFMQYNTENFFDTAHDEGTEDFTYLPLETKNAIPGFKEICEKLGSEFYVKECLTLNWDSSHFDKKIANVSQVIRAFDDSGKGPDILVLQEIENKTVLAQLVTKGLRGMGYAHQAIIEGDDTRGIDNAVVSRYPIMAAKRYPIIFNGSKLDTRGILEVQINVEGHKVVVYNNHWPSQSNPTEQRIESARLLSSLAQKQSGSLIIALGDFNTIETDLPSPFGFMPEFIDAEAQARLVRPDLHPGTYFYRGNWNSLDHIFIYKKSVLKPLYEKFQIIHRPFMMVLDARSGQMIPRRFNFSTAEGFSDHLPTAIELSF